MAPSCGPSCGCEHVPKAPPSPSSCACCVLPLPAAVQAECVRRQEHFCQDAYPHSLPPGASVVEVAGVRLAVYERDDIVSASVLAGKGWENNDLAMVGGRAGH